MTSSEPLLAGRTAIVTGAGKGIGRAVSKALLAAGASVVGVARTAADLAAVAAEVGDLPFDPQVGDVCDEAVVERVFAQVDATYPRLDILVNNAGQAPFGSICELAPARFRECLELNIWAAFLWTQQAVRRMRDGGGGKIVNIGSVRSHWTEAGDAGAYNASKFGLRGFTESVARELQGSGLRIAVSLICPGLVDTPLVNPQGRELPHALQAEQIARAVLHTVSAPLDVNVYDTIVMSTSQRPW
ncbi:MAG: SDR family oxidoreductase [Fimbriimonadaceae bacterium]|nr:SDR family oxidoreductase [Fimbriimonadaceae bacterium]